MPLGGIFHPSVHRTVPLVGSILVTLGNTRRNGVKRPPRHCTVVRKNCSIHRRIWQSNNPRPHSANNSAMTCAEQPESSSCRNQQANQSNPSILPFLDMHILSGASCTPPLITCRGLEVTDNENPSMKQRNRSCRPM